tara:strand:+ start:252 stop:572 length:321 start_codon:yes stop_codon:yes gene_type:complete
LRHVVYRYIDRLPLPGTDSSYGITTNIEKRRDAARVTAFTYLTMPLIERSSSAYITPRIGIGGFYYHINDFIISLATERVEETRSHCDAHKLQITDFLLAMDLITW